MNESVIGINTISCSFNFIFGSIIIFMKFVHNIGNHEGRRPRNSSIAMNQYTTIFSPLIDNFVYLIKKLRGYFLRFVIMNVIKVMLTILWQLLLDWHSLLSNRDNCLKIVFFVNFLIHC